MAVAAESLALSTAGGALQLWAWLALGMGSACMTAAVGKCAEAARPTRQRVAPSKRVADRQPLTEEPEEWEPEVCSDHSSDESF